MSNEVKVGVHLGGGPPPGYQWTVLILDVAYEESRKFLTEDQYQHMAMQVKELARESDPTHPLTALVDAVENFHELRDKGGILGGLNVRVFFYVDKTNTSIVILGAIKKQNDGQILVGDKRRMARRLRKYQDGTYGQL